MVHCRVLFKTIVIVLFAFVSITQVKAEETIFQQILNNIKSEHLGLGNGTYFANLSASYLNLLQENGSFRDVDYGGTSQTNWESVTHYTRILNMAYGYVLADSPLRGNEQLYNAINKALLYFATVRPKSTNWWYQSIGWPQNLGLALCIMRFGEKQLPSSTEKAVYDFMKSVSATPSEYTGANKQDIALHWLYFHVLMANKQQLDYAVEEFNEPMTFTTDEGLQHDYSYQQHKNQLYTAGYGGSVLTAYFKMAFYIKNTIYDTPATTGVMSGFVRYGYLPIHRGLYTLYNTGGRGHLGRVGALINGNLSGYLTKMAILDPDYAEYYQKAIARMTGAQPVSYGVDPWHYHYWRSDYSVHQRPGYTIDIRSTSTRTCRSENGNGENLKGFFCAEGATEIVVDGDEYLNIFPLWDWSRIPGTTTPHMTTIPNAGTWGQYGTSKFTGGVYGKSYGCMTYHYDEQNYGVYVSAKKSWFCFDNEVVCLGNNIKSSNAAPVNTTVNQTLLKGAVTAEDAQGEEKILTRGEHSYTNLRWLNQNKVSYYFPENAQITVRNDQQSGDWNSVSSAIADKTVLTGDVFLTYFDHGKTPQNDKYAYYILPNTKTISEAKKNLDSMTVVNADSLQGVYNHSLKQLQAVFHSAGSFEIGDSIKVSVGSPCVLLLTDVGTDSAEVFVADPLFNQDSCLIYLFTPNNDGYILNAQFPKEKGYLGSTVNYDLKKLPKYKAVKSIIIKDQIVEISHEQLYKTVEIETEPSDATIKRFICRSSDPTVASVGEDGTVVGFKGGTTLVEILAVDGPSASFQVKVADDVVSFEANADATINSGSASINYGSEEELYVRNDGNSFQQDVYMKLPIDFLKDMDITGKKPEVKLLLSLLKVEQNANEHSLQAVNSTRTTWKEDVINWTNKPSDGIEKFFKLKCPTYSPGYNGNNNILADISEYVMERYDIGNSLITVHISQTGSLKKEAGVVLGARENPNPAYRPRVYVYFDGISKVAQKLLDNELKLNGRIITTASAQNIRLYSADGSLIINKQMKAGESLSLQPLASGVYLLKADKQTKKLVLK